MNYRDKAANKEGPHKLLALDGGGIRGIITLEILAEMEKLLQEELGRDDTFVLADYFDYIAGTSTGAIIAACLSLGMRVAQIREFYFREGKNIFAAAPLLRRFHYRFSHRRLENLLKKEFRKEPQSGKEFAENPDFGSDRLRTLLLIVLRNHSTDSPWPLSNNPFAMYNKEDLPDCNLRFPLWQLVRASTAAPTYFQPERIDVPSKDNIPAKDKGQRPKRTFVFEDGGVTMYNNPAFQLFLMATIDTYELCWPTGEEKLLLISIGTGTNPSLDKSPAGIIHFIAEAMQKIFPSAGITKWFQKLDVSPSRRQMNILFNARAIPAALMYAALNEQDRLCRIFGKCIWGSRLDSEVGDLRGEHHFLKPKLFTYARYDIDLSQTNLNNSGLGTIKAETVQRLDSVKYVDDLQRIGQEAAKQVKREHFEGFLF